MTALEGLEVLTDVLKRVNGTYEDHARIQAIVVLIRKELSLKDVSKEDTDGGSDN